MDLKFKKKMFCFKLLDLLVESFQAFGPIFYSFDTVLCFSALLGRFSAVSRLFLGYSYIPSIFNYMINVTHLLNNFA